MPNQILVKSRKPKKPPKYWRKEHPIKAFKAPKPPLYKRFFRLIFNGYTASITLALLLGVFLTATYFWFEFSDIIDRRLLSGEVFTQNAGIYSAPKILRNGEVITAEDLVNYLKSAGYIEMNNQADPSRSRYQIDENQIEIEPGITGMIDGTKVFSSLTVKFKKTANQLIRSRIKRRAKKLRKPILSRKS